MRANGGEFTVDTEVVSTEDSGSYDKHMKGPARGRHYFVED